MPVCAVILVHSPLVGPLTWSGVAAELTAAGHTAFVPDLRGAGDTAAILDAVADQIPTTVDCSVLIGHSGAGPLLTAIADRLGTTSAIVYVDAGLPRPGVSWVDEAPDELVELIEPADHGTVKPWHEWWPPQALAEILPDPAQRAAFVADVPSLPWSFFTEPAPQAAWTGPQSYLLLSEGYEDAAERMRTAGHPVVELRSDHLAPYTRPTEVAAALLDLLDAPPSGLNFGRHAQTYDDVRPEYPADLIDQTLAYAGHPSTAVEVGAGTGKAAEGFASRLSALTCVEPDPAMAAMLRRRFADRPRVTVVEQAFEQWTAPPGGTPLLYFALSWHWAQPGRRAGRAAAALSPRGTLALLDHQHAFADAELEARLDEVYDETAPQLRAEPKVVGVDAAAARAAELESSGLFSDIRTTVVAYDHPYPTERYVGLLRTFSWHLAVAAARRRRLHERIAEVVDAAGGVVVVRLITTLVLARRVD